MSNAKEPLLEFQCPKCSKKLKAPRQVSGKRVKCPQCSQTVKVPGVEQSAQAGDDDWLSLDLPAQAAPANSAAAPRVSPPPATAPGKRSPIPDAIKKPAAQNQNSAASNQAASSSGPRASASSAATAQPAKPASVGPKQSLKKSEARTKEAGAAIGTPASTAENRPASSSRPAKTEASGASAKRSVFDDDLPDLSALASTPSDTSADFTDLISLDGFDELPSQPGSVGEDTPLNLEGFDDLGAIPLVSAEIETQAQYRIKCMNCDTPQYVTLAQKGQTIQCPDCFIRFTIPGPPVNWNPTKSASVDDWGKGHEVRLAPVDNSRAEQEAERERKKAADILSKAQRELDDEIDEMYGTDFDTKGFFEKTLGFLRDPVIVMQLVLYGGLFALMFGCAQYSVMRMAAGDVGYGILLFGAVPAFAAMVCLPMLSGAMALLESVANGQKRMAAWPSFNVFEQLSEILLIGSALGGAMLLGLIAGGLVGRVVGSNWIILVGILGTTFLLFPILLLSVLDNGSMFQPVSTQVFRSLTGAAEAWGGYYLKTLFGFFCVQVAWFLLLGRNPVASAVGGFLVPWLLYFTCQQIGTLAQGIGEFLSFEFASKDED